MKPDDVTRLPYHVCARARTFSLHHQLSSITPYPPPLRILHHSICRQGMCVTAPSPPHCQTPTGHVGASVWSAETTCFGSTQVSFQGGAERGLFSRHSLAGLGVRVCWRPPTVTESPLSRVYWRGCYRVDCGARVPCRLTSNSFWLACNWCCGRYWSTGRSDDTRIALWSIFQDEH